MTHIFHYCPRCASSDLKQHGQQFSCVNPDCQQVFFQNVAAATAALIVKDEQLLLIRRAKEPGLGKLGFPGGFVDPGESLERALTREVKEEIGLDCCAMSYLYSACNPYEYAGIVYYTSDAFFEVEVLDHNFKAEPSEVQEVLWLPIVSIKAQDFAFKTHANAFECWKTKNGKPGKSAF
ncbi:NUDIX domain-containing protein [Alginatibacterium sediminis]|uniref:NUDIX domain-containing protein n=1 Tax=Alginatibacterium sediminis TaxID=2164068 RepID=A0A420E660_9ALTE|nr:NUDIX domain-containing protein [Alginatibacterium sediminis]RKF13218.1 NUDIX domain-containing protein [Alginatibacterium sediminis]